MPVCEDSSIVPDSTISLSPPATPHLVKRAVRTYGRPRHVEAAGDDSDTSLIHSAKSSGSCNSVYRTGPLDLNEEIPPSSDPAPSYSEINHADDEDDNASHDASPKYEFDWKRKLKEMDDQEDFYVDMAGAVHERDASPSGAESGDIPALSPQRPERKGEAHIPTSPLDSGIDTLAETVFGGTLNTFTASPSPHRSFRKSSSQSAPNRRRIKRVIQDSDSEDGDTKDSSPTSPAFPHAITTPKLHSSPTPPTSDDDMSTRLKRDPKGRAKANASARPNVPPLRFSEEPSSTSAVKPQITSSKDIRSKKRKIKAPTKKELAETARDRVRIAAEQRIAIPRAEGAINKYTIPGLFTRLSEARVASETRADPDPIADFSSDPVTSPEHRYVAPLPPTLRQGDGSPLQQSPKRARRSPLKAMVSLPELEDESDMELPEVGALIAQEKEKEDHVKRRQELLEAKKRAIVAQSAKPRNHDDDDDDLEIVQAPDMQMAIKEEDAERRSGRKKRMSEGRKRQLNLGGIGLSNQKAKESPARLKDMKVFMGSGKQKGKRDQGQTMLTQLNRKVAAAVEAQRQSVIKEKEDEWTRRGGKIISGSEAATSSVQEASRMYLEKGLKLPEAKSTRMDVDLDDESDGDWEPERRVQERGSASPSLQSADSGDEDAEEGENQDLANDADVTMVNEDPTSPTDDEDVEERLPVNLRTRRSNKQIVNSDSEAENDENGVSEQSTTIIEQERIANSLLAIHDSGDERAELRPLPKPPMLSHRGSLSSMDEPTEDEGDKENETSRMWDRGEDKENKAVVRHAIAGIKSPFGTRKSSLFDLESGPPLGLPTSPGLDTLRANADDNDLGKGDENRRPFKNLLDDDPFLSPSRDKLPPSFEARLKQASPATSSPSPATFSPAPLIGVKHLGFSQFPDDESKRAPGPAPLQPSFSDLFESGTEKQGSSLKKPLGGLSASFPDEPSSHNKFGRNSLAGDLGLTQDVTLQPAFQVSGNLLRKADQIFEKEQEFVLDAANKKPQRESVLYVNDHGFLTQTRPDVGSPEIYRAPSPTQGIAFNQPSEPQSSKRHPLRTISLSDDMDFGSPTRLNRLRKRATTPTSPLLRTDYKTGPSHSPSVGRPVNVFDEMKRAAKARAERPKRKLERSEFIEQEAQESDDDEMFGFGPREKDKDDEGDGEDLDKTLETLVDDNEMDEETIAAQLVIEKYKEQEEADDIELEKLHQAAVQGELRKKRRNRGIGMEDSDDDSDEDEANRRIRRGMHKKQKIDRDNIKELGEHQETKSFYDVYEGDLIAGNEDFMYLQDSQPQDVAMANLEQYDEDEEPREAITTSEIHRRVREIAQQSPDEDEEYSDPRDVSWIDQDGSDEEDLRVKSVDFNVRRQPVIRRRGMDQEFDAGFEMPPPKPVIAEGNISRMQSWAKVEGSSRRSGTTGRNVGGAAVTGHKAKSGGGSLRRNSAASSGASELGKPAEQRRPVKAQPSLLANVAAERRTTRFG